MPSKQWASQSGFALPEESPRPLPRSLPRRFGLLNRTERRSLNFGLELPALSPPKSLPEWAGPDSRLLQNDESAEQKRRQKVLPIRSPDYNGENLENDFGREQPRHERPQRIYELLRWRQEQKPKAHPRTAEPWVPVPRVENHFGAEPFGINHLPFTRLRGASLSLTCKFRQEISTDFYENFENAFLGQNVTTIQIESAPANDSASSSQMSDLRTSRRCLEAMDCALF